MITGVIFDSHSSSESFFPIFITDAKTLGPPPPNSTDFRSSGSTFTLKNSSGKSSATSSNSLKDSQRTACLLILLVRRPQKFFPFPFALQAKTINTFRELDQRGLKKPTATPPLIPKMRNAQPGLGVGIQQPFVTLMHTWRHILCLANLIGSNQSAIENLKYQYPKLV